MVQVAGWRDPVTAPAWDEWSSSSTTTPSSSTDAISTPSFTIPTYLPTQIPTSVISVEQCESTCLALSLHYQDLLKAVRYGICTDPEVLKNLGYCYSCQPTNDIVHAASQQCDITYKLSKLRESVQVELGLPTDQPTKTPEPIEPIVITQPVAEAAESGVSTTTKIAIGVSAAILPVLIVVVVLCAYYRRRQRRADGELVEKALSSRNTTPEENEDLERQQHQHHDNQPPQYQQHPYQPHLPDLYPPGHAYSASTTTLCSLPASTKKPEDQDLAAALHAVSQVLTTPSTKHHPPSSSTSPPSSSILKQQLHDNHITTSLSIPPYHHTGGHKRSLSAGGTPRESLDKRLPTPDDVYVVHMYLEEQGRSPAVMSCEAHARGGKGVRWEDEEGGIGKEVMLEKRDTTGQEQEQEGEREVEVWMTQPVCEMSQVQQELRPWVRGHRPRLSLQTTNLEVENARGRKQRRRR
ncbi:hypothetical protein EX30DRAFT_398754 [Ascodesmis nigricans]|uniref:Uncharacterized protein n=1 Tax=Ascodesmis nigricans TaxID=341454 RepID=A0A4V3SHQ6_9PEZI|nr:hypothetical protein EX30DRAFT_398754 [Ascodesmis nigricans]